MRLVLRPLIAAATSVAVLSLAASAQAGADGGAQAPSAPLSGGSEYGLTSPSVPHPIVTSLAVPATSVPGPPPRVTVRIDEPHVSAVYATVAINDLSTRKPAVVANLGLVRTARAYTVRWPRAAGLKAGTYHVSVSAHDRQHHSLTRSAHSSGVSTLTVAAPAAAPAPAPPVTALEPGVPTPAQTVGDGAVFPVAGTHNFGGPENRFGAARSGHIHEGQDVLTAEGTPVVAPLAGTITSTNFQAAGRAHADRLRLRVRALQGRLAGGRQRTGRHGRSAAVPGRPDGRRHGSASALRDVGRRLVCARRPHNRSARLPRSLGTRRLAASRCLLAPAASR
jgi:murein DD-endopeptidase MepM/ murein hydrolase activator NlpD